MDRARLERYLDEGLSLAAIGERTDRHPSTVSYWLRKYGLTAAHRDRYAAKGAIGEEALAALVAQGLSVRDIAAALDVGYSTVRYWLARYGLRTQRARRAAVPADERPLTVMRVCRHHGHTTFVRVNARHSSGPSNQELSHQPRRAHALARAPA